MKLAINYTIILAVLAGCCVQAAPQIQKLKKVSKPEGKPWIVTIYKDYTNSEDLTGKISSNAKNEFTKDVKIASSKFRSNTDGLLTNKLHFDFSDTQLNRIEYGPTGKECKVRIAEFSPVKDLTASLNDDCTITFAPEVTVVDSEFASESVSKRPTVRISVQVPENSIEKWSIASGDLTPSKLKNTKKKYKLDEISGTAAEINNKKLKIYTEAPSKIAVKKASDLKYTITPLPKKYLDTKPNNIEIGSDGKVIIPNDAPQASNVAPVVVPEEEQVFSFHGLTPKNLQ